MDKIHDRHQLGYEILRLLVDEGESNSLWGFRPLLEDVFPRIQKKTRVLIRCSYSCVEGRGCSAATFEPNWFGTFPFQLVSLSPWYQLQHRNQE